MKDFYKTHKVLKIIGTILVALTIIGLFTDGEVEAPATEVVEEVEQVEAPATEVVEEEPDGLDAVMDILDEYVGEYYNVTFKDDIFTFEFKDEELGIEYILDDDNMDVLKNSFISLSESSSTIMDTSISYSLLNPTNTELILLFVTNGVVLYDYRED